MLFMASCHSCTAAHIKLLKEAGVQDNNLHVPCKWWVAVTMVTHAVHMVGAVTIATHALHKAMVMAVIMATHAVHKVMVVVVTMATELVYQVHCIHVKCTV